MTQQQIAIEYIKEFGSILPAKISGFFYKGHICGSEMSKRCRELRKRGILRSEPEGKFTRYFLNENNTLPAQGTQQLDPSDFREARSPMSEMPPLTISGFAHIPKRPVSEDGVRIVEHNCTLLELPF